MRNGGRSQLVTLLKAYLSQSSQGSQRSGGGRSQWSEDERRRSEDRGRRTEDRRRMTEDCHVIGDVGSLVSLLLLNRQGAKGAKGFFVGLL